MKSAYLEIGNKCFCKCIICDAHKNKRKEVPFDTIKKRIQILKRYGFKEIRLAGNDPLTHPHFSKTIKYIHDGDQFSDVTTTLLGGDLHSLIDVNNLRISILGLYSKYESFMQVDKFELFCANLKFITRNRIFPLTINYTLIVNIDNLKTNCTLLDAANLNIFMKEYLPNVPVHFFPEIRYTEQFNRFDKDLIFAFLDELRFKFKFFGFDLKKQTSCNLANKRIYVNSNGDCFVCCMAGGEIGQSSVEELNLGNIDDGTLQLKELINLDNYICDKCTPKYYGLMED